MQQESGNRKFEATFILKHGLAQSYEKDEIENNVKRIECEKKGMRK